MLWIAIHLPRLPLEVFLRGTPAPEPFAVADSRGLILACDRKAELRGVAPGMPAPAALALAARLLVRTRDPAAETEAVLGFAAWAAQFTPAVAIALPDSVLLEVAGSLQLFGGIGRITAALQAGLADMGFTAAMAAAPTPLAASWMALAASSATLAASSATLAASSAMPGENDSRSMLRVVAPEHLEGAVAALPLAVLRDLPDIREALQALGINTLGGLLALPRDGVARRFGQPLLDALDRALARLPDPRTPFRLPERFHAGIELPVEVTQAEALLFAARRLLVQLAGFLAARSGGVQRIAIRLLHREAATEVPIGLVAPSRDSTHFTLLLRERLAALALREPVRAITVAAGDILPLAGENLSLLASDAPDPGSWDKLIERLRARLGARAVHGVASADEHRPERASIAVEPRQPRLPLDLPGPPGERPFWLLEQPRPIREIGAVPHHDGPLELLAGPERIETGWWDGGEVARDYFVARSPQRSLLWIYRERKALDAAAGWYLHGIFA